jgi:hypothetical protein
MEDTVFLMRPCRGLKCGGKVLRVYLKINASPHKKYFVSEVYKMQRIYKLTKKIKDLGIFWKCFKRHVFTVLIKTNTDKHLKMDNN